MVVTEGERRVVAVLMADVAGSTAIGEQLGPERSKFLFDEVVRLMSEQIERYDGTVAQLLGDGLLAVFGAPVAHEDDSERAVRAGLAIQRALAAYSREVDDAYGIELRARVAVNTGPVLITPDGDGSDRWNALGDTVNVTARLQALAGEAEVTLGPETAAQVRDCFELEELGATELRGRSRPVDIFRVVSERDRHARSADGPLVGRDAELATVRAAFERTVDGIGVIVSVTGEPGIGKSRLVAEAVEPAARPRAPARGPQPLLRAGVLVLADPRPAARLAGGVGDHRRGAGAARPEGGPARALRPRRRRPLPLPGQPPRPAGGRTRARPRSCTS